MRNPGRESLVLTFVVATGCSGVRSFYQDLLRIKWIVVSLIFRQCAIAGRTVNDRIYGILINDRNRASLQRFRWVAWLIVQPAIYRSAWHLPRCLSRYNSTPKDFELGLG